MVDSQHMLGISRKLTTVYDEELGRDVTTCEHTMKAYVEGMYAAFSDYINPNHKPTTPFPVKLMLTKSATAPGDEHQVVLDRGYSSVVGMLLWAVRRVYPEAAQGVNQLGSLLSCPTEEAWTAAMHVVSYMYQQRERGIKFSSEAPPQPVVFSDASNKPDKADGLSRYGSMARTCRR